MRVRFSSIAISELKDAVDYYEAASPGLGLRFRNQVKHAAKRIAQYPEAWPIETAEIRKCLLEQFPYKLVYAIEQNHVLVIAIAHQHRLPRYWINRQDRTGR